MGRATSTFASARFTKPHFTSLAEFVRARKNFILSFEPFSCSLLPGPERSDLNARLRRHTFGTHQLTGWGPSPDPAAEPPAQLFKTKSVNFSEYSSKILARPMLIDRD